MALAGRKAQTILTQRKATPVVGNTSHETTVTSVEYEQVVRGLRPLVHRAISEASRERWWAERCRRAVNILVAFVGLVLIAPLMLFIAVAIRLTSRGPVIFRQQRVGLDRRSPERRSANGRRAQDVGGRPFTIYKFRTMRSDRGAVVQEQWASPHDPRVTTIGKVLRQLRLDELPQLVNVLKGDMNLVGPRPEQPAIASELGRQISGYAERHRVLPGITGWAQVQHHYDTCLEDVRRKVALDLEYVARRSLTEDFKIMAMTLPVIVFRKGAW
jgi:lipopolysaccharide/colanic/teichoic acid biosynthesis glycosyltransferase